MEQQLILQTSGQKSYFTYSDGVNTQRLSGISSTIASLIYSNLDKVVTFNEITQLTHGRQPDFFLQRSIDVHLCKVKIFLETKGFKLERIRKTGVMLSKIEDVVK